MARVRPKRVANGNIGFRIQITPSPADLRKLYRALGEKTTDFRPAWKQLAAHLENGIKQNIRSEGATIRDKWPAWPSLDPKYEARKRKEGGGSRALKRSGKLEKSIRILSMTRTRLRIGTRLPYAPALQFGNKRTGMKGRAFIGWSKSMQARSTRIMGQFAQKVLQQFAQGAKRLG